jgi:hypothetical protein
MVSHPVRTVDTTAQDVHVIGKLVDVKIKRLRRSR